MKLNKFLENYFAEQQVYNNLINIEMLNFFGFAEFVISSIEYALSKNEGSDKSLPVVSNPFENPNNIFSDETHNAILELIIWDQNKLGVVRRLWNV